MGFIIPLLFTIFSINSYSNSPKLYCGSFHWSGKFATDNIWIEDGKFNPSIDSNTEDFTKFYNEIGLQTWKEGTCICVKGIVEKSPKDYETSGNKQFLFKKLTGLFTCNTHIEIKTDIETLAKLGLRLEPHYQQNKEIFLKWGLMPEDVLMSIYDKNKMINSGDALAEAIKMYAQEKKLKFRIIRKNKVEYIDYHAPGKKTL